MSGKRLEELLFPAILISTVEVPISECQSAIPNVLPVNWHQIHLGVMLKREQTCPIPFESSAIPTCSLYQQEPVSHITGIGHASRCDVAIPIEFFRITLFRVEPRIGRTYAQQNTIWLRQQESEAQVARRDRDRGGICLPATTDAHWLGLVVRQHSHFNNREN